MTSIDPTSLLLAELRARTLSLRRPATEPGGDARAGAGRAREGAPSTDRSLDLAQAIGAISPDDPHRRRKAFRAFLQHALAEECGLRQTDDPTFQPLVDQVQQSMELDARLRRAMDSAGGLLLDRARR